MLVAQVIKSDHCARCKSWLPRLESQGCQFLYSHKIDESKIAEYLSKKIDFLILYDADRTEHQPQLDEWGILEMPVVQIIELSTRKVIYSFPPGPFSIRSIKSKMSELSER